MENQYYGDEVNSQERIWKGWLTFWQMLEEILVAVVNWTVSSTEMWDKEIKNTLRGHSYYHLLPHVCK